MLAAGLRFIHRRGEDRRNGWASSASWIWYARAGRLPRPLRFYAERDVLLPSVPPHAEARFLVDPSYALFVNGAKVAQGGSRPGDALTAADLVPHLRAGANRIVIEASSPDGVGGILFTASGEGLDADAFASSSRWRVALDRSALERGEGRPAIEWGKPPQYPWSYLRAAPR